VSHWNNCYAVVYRDLQGARAWILLKAAEGWTDERVAERWRLDGRPLNAPESAL
jgi:hypothetical protein